MQPSPREIADSLSKAQREALMAFPDDTPVRMADGTTIHARAWCKASEIGVSGNTLSAMQMLGGVNPKTLEPGPALTMDDWGRWGRHWAMTDLGLAVRRELESER